MTTLNAALIALYRFKPADFGELRTKNGNAEKESTEVATSENKL